jgi:hypothetical protein
MACILAFILKRFKVSSQPEGKERARKVQERRFFPQVILYFSGGIQFFPALV